MTKQATPLRKRQLVESFMREAILAAAKKVLAARTYDRTSLDRIAQAAQVSKGSIYTYFRSKEELLWEVLKGSLQRFIESGKAAAGSGDGNPVDRLHALVRAHLELFAQDPDTFKIALAERTQLILDPRGHEIQTLWQVYQEYAGWVGELFEQAAAAGLLCPVPGRRAALMLLDMVHMVTYQRLAVPWDTSPEQDANQIMELFVHGFGPGDALRGKRRGR